MHIAWGSLGLILVVGLVAGAGLASVFAVGVRSLSHTSTHPRRHGRLFASALAGTCFAICVAGVVYGIYLLVPAFH